MKIHNRLRELLVGEIKTKDQLDVILSKEGYAALVSDDDDEIGLLKYSNGKSQIWIKTGNSSNEEYLIDDVTLRTKKSGKTVVHAFRQEEDIKRMMDYFRDNGKNEEFLIFMLGILLARRIGDTLSLKWSDFYYENGQKKDRLDTLIEQKTDKIVEIQVTDVAWKYIDWYCEKESINPVDHYDEYVFPTSAKTNATTSEQLADALSQHAASFRYQFKMAAKTLGIAHVSTHSLRKSFGFMAHQIYQFDPDCLQVLKSIYGHENIETTKIYCDIIADKAETMFNGVSQRVSDIDNGVKQAIENVPVVAFKTNDFRDIIFQVIKDAKDLDKDMALIMKEALDMCDKKRIM